MENNKEKNFVSAVIYVYNNEKEITNMLKNVNEVLKNNFNKYEIICVNDGSTDNSAKKIKEFSNNLGENILSVINMSYYQGLELAMNAGIDLSIGDFVYEFDSVLQDYNNELIMDVYRKSLENYDIVSATSKKNKRKTSSMFYKIFNKYSNLEYKIQTETFRIISRRAINRVYSTNQVIPYRKAVYANCGLKMFSIEYNPIEKNNGKLNKEVKKTRQDTATSSIILFTNLGYKISLTMSIIMILFTIFTAIYSIVIFASGKAIQGWTTTMLFLSFAFFILFGILTVIIKYLEILLNITFKSNMYKIETIDKLN